MVLSEAVLARVVSSLRPWMESESSVDLRLGFLRSRMTARRLRVNAKSLDSLLSESCPMCFESATIDEFIVDFSLFTSPVLKIDVSGVRFSLQFRRKGRSGISGDSDDIEKKQKIALHDPEGISLHNAIENMISEALHPRNKATDSFISIIMKHIQVSIRDIDIHIKIPNNYSRMENKYWNGDHSFCLSISRFVAKGHHFGYFKLLKGIIGVLLNDRGVTHAIFELKDLSVKLKPREGDDRRSCLLSLESLSLSVGMKKLQPSIIEIDIPELSMEFSYRELSVIILMYAMCYTESLVMPLSNDFPQQDARNGKVLWKAARQMLKGPQRFSLHKLVNLVILWHRYVQVYGSVLQQLGFPAADVFFKSRASLLKDARFCECIKQLWELASEMEKDLPAEGVALGRRMARHKSTVSCVTSRSLDNSGPVYLFFLASFRVFLRAPLFLIQLFIFSVNKLFCIFYYMYRSIWYACTVVGMNLENNEANLSEGSFDSTKKYGVDEVCCHITVGLSKLILSIETSNIGFSNGRETSANEFQVDLLNLCILLNDLHVNFESNNNVRHLMFSCGELLAHSCTAHPRKQKEVKSNTDADNPIKQHTGHEHTLKTILSCCPAVFTLEELDSLIGSNDPSGILHKGVLKRQIDEICLDWKNSFSFSKLKNIHSVKKPFILCGLKSFVINPYTSDGN